MMGQMSQPMSTSKFQVVLTDGSVKTVAAINYVIKDGFLFFYGKDGSTGESITVDAIAISTVKSFSQLPAGAA